MLKFKNLLVAVVALSAIMFTGCQNEPAPVEQDVSETGLSKVSELSIPEGTFESATFNIWVSTPNSRDINLHRITLPWIEGDCTTGVSWNSFGGAFASGVEGSFNAAAIGLYTVDVTSLVGSWLDGTNANYGILLDQAAKNFPRAYYNSRENSANQPFLEICYWEGQTLTCVQVEPFGDTYIYQTQPDENNGCKTWLNTGWEADWDWEKQALIKFDIEQTPQEDCETAYAYDDDPNAVGTCFIDLGFGNWGWSIYLPFEDIYTFPVYAAAGQCDLSKGTYVGDVTVDYSGGTVQFTYNFFSGFSAEETHFYAGDTPVPTDNKGNPTVAPGKYTIGTGLSGGIYIIAHAVVCGNFE